MTKNPKPSSVPVSSPDQSELAAKLREFLSYKSTILLECDRLKRQLRAVSDDLLYALRGANGKAYADLQDAFRAKSVKPHGFSEQNEVRLEIISDYEKKQKELNEMAGAIAGPIDEASLKRQKEIELVLETTCSSIETAIRPFCLDDEECARLVEAFALVQELNSRKLYPLGEVQDLQSVATAASRLLGDLSKPLPESPTN